MKHAPTGKNGSTSGPTTATTPAANPAAGPAATMGGWLHAAAAVKPTATASALAGKDAEILKLKDDIATLKRLNIYTAKKAPPAKNKARPFFLRTLTPVLTRRQLPRSEPALRGRRGVLPLALVPSSSSLF